MKQFSFHIPTLYKYAYTNGSAIYYYENYFNYSLLSLWFQRHKHGLQAMEENIRTRDYVPQITGDNRQILGRFDNCTHSKTVRKDS